MSRAGTELHQTILDAYCNADEHNANSESNSLNEYVSIRAKEITIIEANNDQITFETEILDPEKIGAIKFFCRKHLS